MPWMTRGRRWLVTAGVAAVCLVASGCSPSVEPPLRLGDPKATFGEGVCGLLGEEELEIALNAPVRGGGGGGTTEADSDTQTRPGAVESEGDSEERGTAAEEAAAAGEEDLGDPDGAESLAPIESQYQGPRPILPGMDMCSRGSDEARAAWGVRTESEDAESDESLEELFQRYADWHDDYLEDVSVEGHDALWDERLGTLVVLTGDHLIGVSLTVSDSDDDEEKEQNGAASDDGGADAKDGEGGSDDEGGAETDDADTDEHLRRGSLDLARRIMGRL